MISAQAKIDALEVAYEAIAQDRHRFICYALPHTTGGEHMRRFVSESLQDVPGYWIASLEAWITSRCNQHFDRDMKDQLNALDAGDFYHVAKDARLRWIKAMIYAIRHDVPVRGDW